MREEHRRGRVMRAPFSFQLPPAHADSHDLLPIRLFRVNKWASENGVLAGGFLGLNGYSWSVRQTTLFTTLA
jgi:hypothetical protein